jgi:hypothetical protein
MRIKILRESIIFNLSVTAVKSRAFLQDSYVHLIGSHKRKSIFRDSVHCTEVDRISKNARLPFN